MFSLVLVETGSMKNFNFSNQASEYANRLGANLCESLGRWCFSASIPVRSIWKAEYCFPIEKQHHGQCRTFLQDQPRTCLEQKELVWLYLYYSLLKKFS